MSFIKIVDYIESEFGDVVASNFVKKASRFNDFVALYPTLGSLEFKEKTIYGFQLTKHNRVFYRIRGEKVIILDFFDVRQSRKDFPK